MSEWQSIIGRDNVTSYGSCIRTYKPRSVYKKHYLIEGDTLQGIALKYGNTMDELKRINKLYGNDSIFLREYLLVTASEEAIQSSKLNKNEIKKLPKEKIPVDANSFLEHLDKQIENTKTAMNNFQKNLSCESLQPKSSRTIVHKLTDSSESKNEYFSNNETNSLFKL